MIVLKVKKASKDKMRENFRAKFDFNAIPTESSFSPRVNQTFSAYFPNILTKKNYSKS